MGGQRITRRGLLVLVLFSALMIGCTIRQDVKPVPPNLDKTIGLIPNPRVRDGFHNSYRDALRSRGYVVEVLTEDATISSRPLTTRYIARWSWDMALYMAFADIEVFHNSELVGRATYDARRGSWTFGKFISADEKVKELVELLFPDVPAAE